MGSQYHPGYSSNRAPTLESRFPGKADADRLGEMLAPVRAEEVLQNSR